MYVSVIDDRRSKFTKFNHEECMSSHPHEIDIVFDCLLTWTPCFYVYEVLVSLVFVILVFCT